MDGLQLISEFLENDENLASADELIEGWTDEEDNFEADGIDVTALRGYLDRRLTAPVLSLDTFEDFAEENHCTVDEDRPSNCSPGSLCTVSDDSGDSAEANLVTRSVLCWMPSFAVRSIAAESQSKHFNKDFERKNVARMRIKLKLRSARNADFKRKFAALRRKWKQKDLEEEISRRQKSASSAAVGLEKTRKFVSFREASGKEFKYSIKRKEIKSNYLSDEESSEVCSKNKPKRKRFVISSSSDSEEILTRSSLLEEQVATMSAASVIDENAAGTSKESNHKDPKPAHDSPKTSNLLCDAERNPQAGGGSTTDDAGYFEKKKSKKSISNEMFSSTEQLSDFDHIVVIEDLASANVVEAADQHCKRVDNLIVDRRDDSIEHSPTSVTPESASFKSSDRTSKEVSHQEPNCKELPSGDNSSSRAAGPERLDAVIKAAVDSSGKSSKRRKKKKKLNAPVHEKLTNEPALIQQYTAETDNVNIETVVLRKSGDKQGGTAHGPLSGKNASGVADIPSAGNSSLMVPSHPIEGCKQRIYPTNNTTDIESTSEQALVLSTVDTEHFLTDTTSEAWTGTMFTCDYNAYFHSTIQILEFDLMSARAMFMALLDIDFYDCNTEFSPEQDTADFLPVLPTKVVFLPLLSTGHSFGPVNPTVGTQDSSASTLHNEAASIGPSSGGGSTDDDVDESDTMYGYSVSAIDATAAAEALAAERTNDTDDSDIEICFPATEGGDHFSLLNFLAKPLASDEVVPQIKTEASALLAALACDQQELSQQPTDGLLTHNSSNASQLTLFPHDHHQHQQQQEPVHETLIHGHPVLNQQLQQQLDINSQQQQQQQQYQQEDVVRQGHIAHYARSLSLQCRSGRLSIIGCVYYCVDCGQIEGTVEAAGAHLLSVQMMHCILPLPVVAPSADGGCGILKPGRFENVTQLLSVGNVALPKAITVGCFHCRQIVTLKVGDSGVDGGFLSLARLLYHSLFVHRPVENLGIGPLFHLSAGSAVNTFPVVPSSESAFYYLHNLTCRLLGCANALIIWKVSLKPPTPGEAKASSAGGVPTQLANMFVLVCSHCGSLRDQAALMMAASRSQQQQPPQQLDPFAPCCTPARTIVVPVRIQIRILRHLSCAFCHNDGSKSAAKNTTFSTVQASVQHLMRVHKPVNKLRCRQCTSVFATLEELLAHCLTHPYTGTYPRPLATCQTVDSVKGSPDLSLGRATLLLYGLNAIGLSLTVPGAGESRGGDGSVSSSANETEAAAAAAACAATCSSI